MRRRWRPLLIGFGFARSSDLLRPHAAAELGLDGLPEAFAAVSVLALQVATDGLNVGRIGGGHDEIAVVALAGWRIVAECQVRGVGMDQRIGLAESERTVAGPAVVARIGHHRGAQGVQFDIAVAVHEVVAIVHHAGLVATLPQRAAAVVGVVDVADVAAAQRLQRARQRVWSFRGQQQVDVVRHQHVGVHRAAFAQRGLPQEGAVAEVVRLGEKETKNGVRFTYPVSVTDFKTGVRVDFFRDQAG